MTGARSPLREQNPAYRVCTLRRRRPAKGAASRFSDGGHLPGKTATVPNMLHAWTDSGRPQTTPRDPEFHAVAGGAERRFRQNGETAPYLVITTARSADFSAGRHGALLSGRVGDGKEAGTTRGEAKAPWPEKQLRQRSSAAFTAPRPRGPGPDPEQKRHRNRGERPAHAGNGRDGLPFERTPSGISAASFSGHGTEAAHALTETPRKTPSCRRSGQPPSRIRYVRSEKDGEDPQTTHPGLLSPPRAHPFAENAPRETRSRTAVPPISGESFPSMREKSTGTRPISGKNT